MRQYPGQRTKLKAPRGKFRVVGVDKFADEDWLLADFHLPGDALEYAKEQTKKQAKYASDSSIATVYYVYNDKGEFLGP